MVTKELTQLHNMGTDVPMDPDEMTEEQKNQGLRSFVFIGEKRNGDIKSRAYVDDSSQRKRPGYKKEDSVSPIVSTDGAFTTGVIKA